MAAIFDSADIRRTWQVYREPGEVAEVRILNAGKWLGTVSGYFDNEEDFTKIVSELASDPDHPVPAIYFTINPVSPDLLARAANRTIAKARNTTSDADIVALHWLPGDLDSKRPAGISSTDEEHDAAIAKAYEVRKKLIADLGWPENAFVLADSGNGAHLDTKIDLQNVPEDVALVKRCLEAMDFLFSDETIHVDTTSQNPARIWKVRGTMARKGDSIQERPHRLSRFIEVPETLETVSREQLEALAAMLPEPEKISQPSQNAGGPGFDVAAYCQAHNLPVHHTKTWTDPSGTKCELAVLEQCVFNPDHHLSAVIIGWPTGARSYRCRHNSCLGKKWKDAKAIIEPGADSFDGIPTMDLTRARANVIEAADEPKLKAEDVCDIEIDEETGDWGKVTLAPTKAAEAILDYFTLAMEKGDDQIYYYNSDGIYDPDGARKIDMALTSAAGDANNNFKLREVLRRVRNHLLEGPVTFDPDPYLLGVRNGVVDLRTGDFREYRPEDLITDRIDVLYDPNAKCPAILAFIESLTPCEITRLMLIDWFAANAIKEPLPYVLFLLGLGRNGKGVYERLLKKFFGQAAFRDMPLQAIEKSDFAASEFYRKRGWIASETGRGKASIGTDFMKLTSGNGVIDANVKGKSRIQYEPYFQTTVDTNTMPQIADNSIGWEERFSAASLPYVFVQNPDPGNPLEKQGDPHLFEKLSTPGELSGLLNLVIYRAKEIAKTKTITRRPGKEMFAEYQEQSASVGTFLDLFCEHVTDGKDFWTPITPIYDAYKEWCGYKVGEVVDSRYFGKQLTVFCGGKDGKDKDNTISKIGKDKDRKSVRLYKRLNFDQDRYDEEAKRLRQTMSTSVYDKSTSSLHGISSTDNDVYVVYIKMWIDIYKRFGNPKDSKNPIYGVNCENNVDNVDNVDIDSSGGPKVSTSPSSDVDSDVDKPPEESEVIFCAKCGDDLTGHGTITKNGVIYCLKPGCGMPAREEAGA